MARPRVSIVLATYNGGRYLRAQLDSIRAGTRLPDELLISDDLSTDDTLDIVHAFAATAPFPVSATINPHRTGVTTNFDRAATLATGDILLFCDQDDVWLPNHLERLAAPFESDPQTAVVVSNSTYVDADLTPTGSTIWSSERFREADYTRATTGWQFPGWVRHRALAGHGMAVRADLRPVILPLDPLWIFDQWISLVAAACGKLVIERQPLTLHRQHASQSIANREQSLTDVAQQTPTLSNDHFANQLAMWTALRDRLAHHPAQLRDPRVLPVIEHKIAFLHRRQAMRTGGPLLRAARAIKELATGGYHRYGRGLLTFARDLAG